MSGADALVAAARHLASGGAGRPGARTQVLGLAGPPGAGKSTVAAQVADALADLGAVAVGMDGFHFAQADLDARGLATHKGAPDTFDGEGLAALLSRVREPGRGDLAAPAYSRELHDVVPGAVAIPQDCGVVIVEGNYLALAAAPWPEVRAQLDTVWFLDVPWEVTRERLIARRVATGRERQAAVAWVDSVDRDNDAVIRRSRGAADHVFAHADGAWRKVPR